MPERPDWTAPGASDPLFMDVGTSLDKWADRLRRAMGGGGGARQTPGEFFFVEYTSTGVESRLWLLSSGANVLRPIIVGWGKQEEREVERWRAAISAANAALTQDDEVFRWRAVIGPAAGTWCLKELAERMTVGPLMLRPGGVRRVEWGLPETPQYGTRTILVSWPFFVEGASAGYDWHVASRRAAADLHGLGSLVSVAWGHPWSVRHLPLQLERAPEIPSIDSIDNSSSVAAATDTTSTRESLPSWVPAAWIRLSEEPHLAHAAGAHSEGLALAEQHPSLALVAFVAAIEVVGAHDVEEERCPECNSQLGAAKSFRRGLRRVMKKREAEALANEVYGRRSLTAHAGKLHGAERYRGALPYFGFFSRPPEQDFAFVTLRRVREASRAVLIDMLSGERH